MSKHFFKIRNPWIMDLPLKKSKSVKKTTFKASTFHHVFRIFPSLSIKERSIFEVRSWILSYYKFLHMIEGAWPCHRVEETATARRHRALSGYNQNWINNKFLKFYLPYARHYNLLLIRNCSWILRPEFYEKKPLENPFLDFKKWVKSLQTAGYNGTRTVIANLWGKQSS